MLTQMHTLLDTRKDETQKTTIIQAWKLVRKTKTIRMEKLIVTKDEDDFKFDKVSYMKLLSILTSNL